MFHQNWTLRFLAHFPITWISFEYLISHGVRPGLAISIPVFYWVGSGIQYLNLTGIKSSKLKELLIVWFWPIHYIVSNAEYGSAQLKVKINKVEVGTISIREYFIELKESLKKVENYWLQLVVFVRAVSLSALIAIVVSPLAIASVALITAYFNKMYLLDLIVRWKDPMEPMSEMRDAVAATKFLMVTIMLGLVQNVFKQSAHESIRIKNGVVYTGNIVISNEKNE